MFFYGYSLQFINQEIFNPTNQGRCCWDSDILAYQCCSGSESGVCKKDDSYFSKISL